MAASFSWEMSPFDDDAEKWLPDDDPDQLLEDARRRYEIERESKATIYDMHRRGMFDGELVPMELSIDDHTFLSALGICAPEHVPVPERTYTVRSITAASLECLMRPVHFGIRLTHLYDAITALERVDARPCVGEYLTILHEAFYTSEMHYLEPGALSIVEGEIDALATQDPTVLVDSQQCADLLRRVDPTLHRYYLYSPGWTTFGLGGA